MGNSEVFILFQNPHCHSRDSRISRSVAVIPKSNSPARLKQNLEVLGFDLTEAELNSISGLDVGLRFNDPGFYLPNYPLRIFA
jgi:D-xylose reductase